MTHRSRSGRRAPLAGTAEIFRAFRFLKVFTRRLFDVYSSTPVVLDSPPGDCASGPPG
jgi:hypothetical protein